MNSQESRKELRPIEFQRNRERAQIHWTPRQSHPLNFQERVVRSIEFLKKVMILITLSLILLLPNYSSEQVSVWSVQKWFLLLLSCQSDARCQKTPCCRQWVPASQSTPGLQATLELATIPSRSSCQSGHCSCHLHLHLNDKNLREEYGSCEDGQCECATQGRLALAGYTGAPPRWITCFTRCLSRCLYISSFHVRVGPWGFGLHTVNCSFHPYGELSLADVETIFQVSGTLSPCVLNIKCDICHTS